MLVDSHCHLDFPEFKELDAVLARAHAAGVGHLLTIGTTLAKFPDVLAVAETSPHIHCSIGVHPHEAEAEPLDGPGVLTRLAQHEKVVAFGETGLDFYYNHAPRAAQMQDFRTHIMAARETGLPVIVHTRDADDDTIAILESEMTKGAFTGVIHCFTGPPRLADAALALGFFISVSGIATFKKSSVLRETLVRVPLDRLLVETDAPYLSPEPFRGKVNEPAFVAYTARMLAVLKGVTEEEIAAITTENFFRLFSKVRPA